MADDHKKKNEHGGEKESEKKFKAVTEELTIDGINDDDEQETLDSSKPTEESKSEGVSEDSPAKESKLLAVAETNNIVTEPASDKHDAGVFLKFFVLTFVATLLALGFAGGVYVYITGMKSGSTTPKATPTPISSSLPLATQTPEASPSGKIDVSTYKVSALNGNGGIGVATAAKAILVKAGFNVSYIGNADNFNFTDTLVQAKSSVPQSVVDIVTNTLSSNYSVKVGDALDPQSTYDIVVTVGSK